MYLLVDIGNTSIKWSLLCEGVLTTPGSLYRTETWSTNLSTIWSTLPTPQLVRIASVAAITVEETVRALILNLWGLVPIFARPDQHIQGLVLAYADPLRLGVDRWLALVAVHKRGYGPVLIVDCGTAVTVDFLDANGHHQGGLIIPGLELLKNTLFKGTGIAQTTVPTDFIGLLGRNTGECISFGAMQAVAGLIERIHKQVCILDTRTRLVLTGGDAKIIAPTLTLAYEFIPELVLEGLASL